MSSSKVIKVNASDLNKAIYCPVKFYYELFTPIKKPLKVKIRLFLGRLYHSIVEFISFKWARERKFSLQYREDVVLVGKPDLIRDNGDHIVVKEIKSSNAPKVGSHFSYRGIKIYHIPQLIAYYKLLKSKYEKPIRVYIKYRDKEVEVPINSDTEDLFNIALEVTLMILKGQLVNRIWRVSNCKACEYSQICNYKD